MTVNKIISYSYLLFIYVALLKYTNNEATQKEGQKKALDDEHKHKYSCSFSTHGWNNVLYNKVLKLKFSILFTCPFTVILMIDQVLFLLFTCAKRSLWFYY